jgi:hypothetical protein
MSSDSHKLFNVDDLAHVYENGGTASRLANEQPTVEPCQLKSCLPPLFPAIQQVVLFETRTV